MIGTPEAVWKVFVSANSRAGMVSFNRYSGLYAMGDAASFEGDAFPDGDLQEYLVGLLQPIYDLLAQAQGWAEANEILLASQAVEAFSRDETRELIRREQIRDRIPHVASCPACA
jgi:hypothetical protein